MLVTKLARVYAKALYDLAIETKSEDAVKADMEAIGQLIAKSREFSIVLKSPVVEGKKKKAIFSEIFKDQISGLSLKFVDLVISHGREQALAAIAAGYNSIYLAKKGILEATVTSAHELSDSVITQLKKSITKELGQEIQLEIKVNADILGGLILRVGDMQYNGSVAAELQRLRLDFKKNLYIADF